jgi:hypothetical protein
VPPCVWPPRRAGHTGRWWPVRRGRPVFCTVKTSTPASRREETKSPAQIVRREGGAAGLLLPPAQDERCRLALHSPDRDLSVLADRAEERPGLQLRTGPPPSRGRRLGEVSAHCRFSRPSKRRDRARNRRWGPAASRQRDRRRSRPRGAPVVPRSRLPSPPDRQAFRAVRNPCRRSLPRIGFGRA